MNKTYFYILPVVLLIILGILLYALVDDVNEFLKIILGILGGVVFGISTSYFFSNRSLRKDLARFGKSAVRWSANIQYGLRVCGERIDEYKKTSSKTYSPEEVKAIFESLDDLINIMARLSLSAIDDWREIMPGEIRETLPAPEQIISDISDNKRLKTIVEKHSFPNDSFLKSG